MKEENIYSSINLLIPYQLTHTKKKRRRVPILRKGGDATNNRRRKPKPKTRF